MQQLRRAPVPAPVVAPVKTAIRKRSPGAASEARAIVDVLRKAAGGDKGDEEADNYSLLLDDSVLADVTEWIPTGFHMLDKILGGGWPVGRASEVFGPEASGKTALAHRAIRACQDAGGIAVLIDAECALDNAKMEQLGIDPARLIYCTPETIEKTWDAIWRIIGRLETEPGKHPMLIVWDSIAASIPKDELADATSDKSHVGLVARAMSRGCRRMFRAIARVRAHMLWINQERDTIGGFTRPGMPKEKVTVGGNAVRYAASIRIRTKCALKLKTPQGISGLKIKATTIKNRLAAPHRSAEFVLDFVHGPSTECSAFHDFMAQRVIFAAGFRTNEDKSKTALFSAAWTTEPFTRDEFIERGKTDETWAESINSAYVSITPKLLITGGSAFAKDDEGEGGGD